MQKFLTILISLLIIYNVLSKTNFSFFKDTSHAASGTSGVEKEKDKTINLEGGLIERSISKIMINIIKTPEGEKFMQNLVQPLQSSLPMERLEYKINNRDMINSMFNIKIITPGYGAEARCGSNVHVKYKLHDMSGKVLEEVNKTIRIGAGEIDLGLENSIIGMRVGEEREASIPTNIIKDKKSSVLSSAKIKLEQLIDPSNITDLKIYDDTLAFAKPILCGEMVKFDIKIKDITGEVIFQKESISSQVGAKDLPEALTQGLYNKTHAGVRTVITKGEYLGSFILQSKTPQTNLGNYYILEISNTDSIPD